MENMREYFNDAGIPLDELITHKELSPDENAITLDGLRVIYRDSIWKYCDGIRKQNFSIDLPNPVNLVRHAPTYNWLLYKDETKRTWAKRYSDYIRDLTGLRLSAELTGKIGEVANRVKGIVSEPVTFDIHIGIDWTPGTFKERSSSCLWTDYNSGREYLNDVEGIAAIRFYDERRNPTGRALLMKVDNQLIVFNLYTIGIESLADVTKVLKSYLETMTGEILAFDSIGLRIAYLYVNHNNAYSIHPENTRSRDVDIDDLNTCRDCERLVDADELTYVDGIGDICDDCLENYYFICDYCQEYHRKGYDDSHMHETVNDEIICDACAYRYFTRCDNCCLYIPNDEVLTEINPRGYHVPLCETCHAERETVTDD